MEQPRRPDRQRSQSTVDLKLNLNTVVMFLATIVAGFFLVTHNRIEHLQDTIIDLTRVVHDLRREEEARRTRINDGSRSSEVNDLKDQLRQSVQTIEELRAIVDHLHGLTIPTADSPEEKK